MDVLIKKAEYLNGEVKAPGSKSYTHRVIAAASLYGSNTLIENPSFADANMVLITACRKLGATITIVGNNLEIKGFKGHPTANGIIDVGNSGTALRIAVTLASLAHGELTIDGDASLRNRPTKPLIDALRKLGATVKGVDKIDAQGNPELYAPIILHANGLRGGSIEISGKQSSQYLTSLLLVSNFAKDDIHIKVNDTIVSRPYIDVTLDVLQKFGLKIDHTDDYRNYYIKANQNQKNFVRSEK